MSYSKPTPSALLATLSGGVAYGAAVFVQAWTAFRHRRAVSNLLAFDDHLLADIGLTRGDVAASLSVGGLGDPSTRLRILAVERRAGTRALRREAITALRAETSDPTGPGVAQTARSLA